MGTISDKLMRIINTKEDIRQALISKGYDVPTSIPFKEYAKMISDLPCKVDDFPKLPGDVTRWYFGGLTNEMMAAMDDPRIEDADHKGRFLSFKNFAWSGMSGVGGYKYNFLSNDWLVDGSQSSVALSHKIVIINKRTSIQFAKLIRNELENTINITLKITGLEANGSSFKIYDNVGSSHAQRYNKDGIYQINYTATEGANRIYFYMPGGNMGQLENPITIEQLPLYPGFILGDGVDDFAVTEKELNFEDTYTVYTAFIPFQNNPTRNMILCGADSKKTFSMQYSSLVYISFIAGNNYYINADFVNGLNLFACKRNGNNICIKNLLTNKVVTGTCGDWVENAGLYYLWKNAIYASFAKAAIAGQTICNGYYSTDEDDEKVLDWYKKQYPWLFPYQAWTVVGKTNEDEDRATIANITGNGNDLVLSNFGFAEGSGYNEEGEYAGYLVTDGVDDKVVSKQFKFGENFTVILDFKFPVKKISYCGFDLSSKVRIQNLQGSGVYVVLKGNRTLIPSNVVRAVTSEGKVYDENWNEYNIVPGNISSNYTMVNLGFDGSNQFAESATKLAGIYSSTLSKDDCIKAYNYLQTIKAK